MSGHAASRRLLKNHNIWLFGVTLLGLALRLFQLGEWSFWHDEALTVLLAQQPIPNLIAITATDVHPPLYFLLVKLFMLLGQTEVAVRLVSALCGAASVTALYFVGKTLFDARVGLVGAAILALSPLQLFYAQEARMYTLLLLLTILSSWCFVLALQNDTKLWWGLFTALATLAGYTAYFAFLVLAAMGLYVLFVDRRRERILHFALSMGGVALLYLPWLGVFLTQTRAVLDTYWIDRPNPLMLFTTLSAFFTGYTLPRLWIVGSLAAVLLVVFVVLNNVRHALKAQVDTQPLLWLLLWSFVPLLGTFLISLVKPIFQLRTVLTATPALYLLVAWGVIRAQQSRVNLLLFLPTLGLMLFSAFNFYFNPAFAKPAWREAAYFVQERVQPGDVVVHTSPGSFVPFLAYPHTVDHLLLPDPVVARENAPSQPIVAAVGGPPQPVEAIGQHVDERVWLVVGLDQSVAHQTAQKEWFDTHYRCLAHNNVNGIYVFTYAVE